MSGQFPSLAAIAAADVRQCLSWNRFLPGPRDDSDVTALNAIVKRLTALRDQDPDAYTAASKGIGWDR